MPWRAAILRLHLSRSGGERTVSDSRTAELAARFFQCRGQDCGLRFPVTPNDGFRGVCPRCRGVVEQVAMRNGSESTQASVASGRGVALHLLLDNWRSSFNVGSALRTADGVGAVMVHLCGITPTPAQGKVAKTALGAESAVAWRYYPDGVAAARMLRDDGARLWVLETLPQAVALAAAILPEDARPLVLVAGNEIAGVDPGIVALADRVIALPMAGGKRSLNVAIALSIAAYWLSLARRAGCVSECLSGSVSTLQRNRQEA
jgi:23S rRNA (guanosine2251-2'-O)-methyltransferase